MTTVPGGEVFTRLRHEDFHPTEQREGVVYPAECNEDVYPAEHSEDVYPTEGNEGVVVVVVVADRPLRSTVKNA